ncbi:cation:proton antiporter [Rhabdobacter roseus]|uniref:NhaP-type Na+/H+ or K+/H+ antiporter n=1 Tax=Rhabdobacter roseus TaxID=1655419 RepID=A0A840TS94_9BACT|nr:cation:proton antiporter [Rhabdobacter roseus]MBB5282870.1 NhaP-type Na+/H+ or K+/H+ antiporter [Rhabdobacter roseus]
MDNYFIVIALIGLAALGMAWMPLLTKKTKVSYAILYVLFGGLIYTFSESLPLPNPIRHQEYTVHLTELVVIITLMGTGLKIDRPFSVENWALPLRLISLTMVLSIALITLIGWSLLGFNLASALLLGAVLAPTDPVLASDVQVGPPREKKEDEVRFALTAEAGLNDGMAFPFTWLAILLAMPPSGEVNVLEWLAVDLIFKIVAGVLAGIVLGRVLAWAIFGGGKVGNVMDAQNGFIAISATLLIYGLTELLHGYGFVSVFVAAVTIRNYELQHAYHTELHAFTDQIERILVAIVLILFGGSLVNGVLDVLTWPMALASLLFIVLVRPLAGYVSLWKSGLHPKQKWALSFFGIKGIGSFYYLAFALAQTHFQYADEIWATAAFTVLVSLVLHGTTAALTMESLSRQFNEEINEDEVSVKDRKPNP